MMSGVDRWSLLYDVWSRQVVTSLCACDVCSSDIIMMLLTLLVHLH